MLTISHAFLPFTGSGAKGLYRCSARSSSRRGCSRSSWARAAVRRITGASRTASCGVGDEKSASIDTSLTGLSLAGAAACANGYGAAERLEAVQSCPQHPCALGRRQENDWVCARSRM